MFVIRILFASGIIGFGAGLTGSGIMSLILKGSSTLGIGLLVGFIVFFFSVMMMSSAIQRRARGFSQGSGLSDDDSGSVMRSQNTNLSLSQGDVVNAAAGLPPGTI